MNKAIIENTVAWNGEENFKVQVMMDGEQVASMQKKTIESAKEAARRQMEIGTIEAIEMNGEIIEQKKEEIEAAATVEAAGKKFKYTVTMPDGTVETSVRTKDSYQYAVIMKTDRHEEYFVLGMNGRRDLAEKAAETNRKRQRNFGTEVEDIQIIEIERN